MTLRIAPDGLVRLGLADTEADHALARLFPALTSRVTDKRGYPPDEVEPPRLAWPPGISVHYVSDPQVREHIADLHRQAVGDLSRTGSFARELAGWLRSTPADPRRDGMTLPLPPDAAGALITALSTSGEPLMQMGERDAQALAAGPLIGLLTSAEETKAAWIRAGLAWQHLALTAHACGLAVAPLTAIVENPAARQGASGYVSAGQHLQMVFRLGKSLGSLPTTPRREPAWVKE
jgi:hypothetical protein